MISRDIYLRIVQSAIKAPSGHNAQPWLFEQEGESIFIMPDYSRSLPVADPDNRELFISLGCAAETAMIAARYYGYNTFLDIEMLHEPMRLNINLERSERIEKPELFSFINLRQTTRNLYDGRPVSDAELIKLKPIVSESGIGVDFYTGQSEIRKLAPYIIEANAIQMKNPSFKKELICWMRFSEKEALQKGDGLYTACSGIPSTGRVLGSFVLKNFIKAKSENIKLLKVLEKTAVVTMFTTQSNDVEQWIKTGMAFQRFALTATKLGLSHSHLNSPCQISQVRDKMKTELGLNGVFPQLLIRLGYSKVMPYAFHRNIYHLVNY